MRYCPYPHAIRMLSPVFSLWDRTVRIRMSRRYRSSTPISVRQSVSPTNCRGLAKERRQSAAVTSKRSSGFSSTTVVKPTERIPLSVRSPALNRPQPRISTIPYSRPSSTRPPRNGRAINLSDLSSLVPVRPAGNPGGVVPLGARAQNIAGIYDSNYKVPYTQNMTLSVTRVINRQFTIDLRYTGTLGRRLDSGVNLDLPNVYHNPELLQALLDARAGTCTANAAGYKSYTDAGINPCDVSGDPVLLDQMMAGLNLNSGLSGAAGTGTFGNVGTVNAAGVFQSGAAHLRRSSTFQNALANGDLNTVAGSPCHSGVRQDCKTCRQTPAPGPAISPPRVIQLRPKELCGMAAIAWGTGL